MMISMMFFNHCKKCTDEHKYCNKEILNLEYCYFPVTQQTSLCGEVAWHNLNHAKLGNFLSASFAALN